MAREPKHKLLTSLPADFDPKFMDNLSRRYGIGRIVLARYDALEAHCGGSLSYVQQSMVKRVIWLELIVESYEQRFAIGEQVDVGAISQLGNTLKGYYKDLGLNPTARDLDVPVGTYVANLGKSGPDAHAKGNGFAKVADAPADAEAAA